MKKALIIVDYVNDFVKDNGSLTCGEPAQRIDASIASIVEDFSKNGDFIAVASDNHTESDVYNPEHNLFPSHCLSGSEGRALYGATRGAVERVKPAQLIHIDKLRYSAFAGTPLDMKLRERGVTEVYLVGVCSDICVLHAAVDAYNLGYKLFIYESGVASFNQEGHKFALAHFKNTLGATIL